MLSQEEAQQGFTLIEAVITVSLIATLLALGISGSAKWTRDARIRSMAESIQSGLQLARVEAVNRNALTRFQLVTGLDTSCELSNSGGVWVVSMNDTEGKCNEPALTLGQTCSGGACIIQTSSGTAQGANTGISSTDSAIIFNGLGTRSAIAGNTVSAVDITITGGDNTSCVESRPLDAGALRCLRVHVSPQGQIRLCDPALTGDDPRSCPE